MKKTFVLCESESSCSEFEGKLINYIAAVILASSIEEAAKIIGGELEKRENETLVWLPYSQFTEVWNGVEYNFKVLESLIHGEHPSDKDESFDADIWFCPGYGRIRFECFEFLRDYEGQRRGLAIYEVPLIVASPENHKREA